MSRHQQRALVRHLRRWLREGYTHLEIHHGDCVGADAEFHDICMEVWPEEGFSLVLHPPENEYKRAFKTAPVQTVRPPKPFLDRNRDIVDEADGMLAAPREMAEKLRSGTWATVRYSRKTSTPLIMLWSTPTTGE